MYPTPEPDVGILVSEEVDSGSGSVGRVVTSNPSHPRFESSAKDYNEEIYGLLLKRRK